MPKKLKVLLVILSLVIISLFLLGCGIIKNPLDLKDDEDKKDEISETGAFANMKPGSWAEYEMSMGRLRMEFIGTDTYEGMECYVIEIEMITEEKVIMQQWLDKETMQTVLLVTKQGEMVIKMDLNQAYNLPTYSPSNPVSSGISDKTDYTTPTGKKVKANVFKVKIPAGMSEVWVSNEVPFNEVKTVFEGEVIRSLYDFGTSGAKRDISKQEAENAKTYDELFGGGGG